MIARLLVIMMFAVLLAADAPVAVAAEPLPRIGVQVLLGGLAGRVSPESQRAIQSSVATDLAALCSEKYPYLHWVPLTGVNGDSVRCPNLLTFSVQTELQADGTADYMLRAFARCSGGTLKPISYGAGEECFFHYYTDGWVIDGLEGRLRTHVEHAFLAGTLPGRLRDRLASKIPIATDVFVDSLVVERIIVAIDADQLAAAPQSELSAAFKCRRNGADEECQLMLSPSGPVSGGPNTHREACMVRKFVTPVLELNAWDASIIQHLDARLPGVRVFMRTYVPSDFGGHDDGAP